MFGSRVAVLTAINASGQNFVLSIFCTYGEILLVAVLAPNNGARTTLFNDLNTWFYSGSRNEIDIEKRNPI